MKNLIDFISEKLKINKDTISKKYVKNVQYIVIYNYDFKSKSIDYELYDTLEDCALGIRELGKNWNTCFKFNNFSEDLLNKFISNFYVNYKFNQENNIETCATELSRILHDLAKKGKK